LAKHPSKLLLILCQAPVGTQWQKKEKCEQKLTVVLV
jgi:hypothetical protein